jgi:hypothetical protein
MTDKLYDAMRAQADRAGFPPIDLDAVMTGGVRKVRRRRTAAAAGAVVGLATAVALAVTLSLPDRTETAPDPAVPFPTASRSLDMVVAAGPRILVVGQPEAVVDAPVTELERTLDEGFVYVTDTDDRDDEPGEVHVLRDGVATDHGPGLNLVADADGHVAAWLRSDDDGTRLVVLDTRTLVTTETVLEPTAGGPWEPVELFDIDGGRAFVYDGRGDLAVDLVTGEVKPLSGTVVDVEGDTVVVSVPDGSNPLGATLYAETPSNRLLLEATQSGLLSPDGRLLMTSGETPGPVVELVDTTTGERTPIDVSSAVPDERRGLQPIGWLDDHTVALMWTADDRRGKLLTCDVRSESCEIIVDELGDFLGRMDEILPVFSGAPTYARSVLVE